jgi:YbgC/YbaW family acyl-CoA thioester hydrolase
MSKPAEGPGFRHSRRVLFYETDLAGVVHFSNYFRYMEEAEHALWRAAGMRIDGAESEHGWPRVSATFDFKAPLFFEDDFEVLVRIKNVTRRTIQYSFVMTRQDTLIGTGSTTAACVTRRHGEPGSMRSVDIPPNIVPRLCVAAGQPSDQPVARDVQAKAR